MCAVAEELISSMRKSALNPGQESSWHIVADTHQDWADIVDLLHTYE